MARKRDNKARALAAAIESFYQKKADKAEATTEKKTKPTRKMGGFGVK